MSLKRYFLSGLLIFNCSVSLAAHYTIPDTDFMESMIDGNKIAKDITLNNMKSIGFFKEHYEAKKPSKMPYHETPLIPKVMHHIWDGPIPPLYQNYLNECKKLHPDWEFKFWSDKDIDDLGLEYRDVYDKARSYAGRSDIARYEILYRFGGVYRDMDVKCFRPIDDLNHKYDFFIPVEPPSKGWTTDELWTDTFTEMIAANNGIIGTKVGHPILKTTLQIINGHFDQLLYRHDHKPDDSIHAFAVRSTLTPLTEGFMQNAALNDKSIALPPTYFFSLLNRVFLEPKNFKARITKFFNKPLKPILFSLKPESLMLHNARPDKREIFYCPFDYGNTLGNSEIKRLFKNLPVKTRKIISTFKMIYEDKAHKGKISLNKKSKMPQVIHFIVFNDQELSDLKHKLPKWKILNGDFDIQIWDKDKINNIFQDITFSNESENLRFYLGLRILEKFGGTYANYRSIPHQPIFELNNRYSFYVGLMPLTRGDQSISFSHKIIASKANHPIVSKTLKKINLKDLSSFAKMNDTLLNETYTGLYFDGANVVFPSVYFEPIAQIPDESLMSKFKRISKGLAKPFSTYTEFTVVE